MSTPDPTTQHTPHQRESSLDFLRGTAVLLMILAHAIFFFHDDSSDLLRILARTGNTVCFTLFLFVSGSSTYFSYLRAGVHFTRKQVGHIITRAAYILLGFYLLAAVASADEFPTWDLSAILTRAWDILTLQYLPGFTEFLLPFVFFPLSVLLFRRLYSLSARSLLVTLQLAALAYLLAWALYPYTLGAPWDAYKALLVGQEGLYRFALFSYAPVYLVGMYWGHLLDRFHTKKSRDRLALGSAVLMISLTAGLILLNQYWPNAVLSPANRWPPSLPFLGLGLSLAFTLKVFYTNLKYLRPASLPMRLLHYLGQDAFDLFLTHTLLLFAYKQLINRQFADPIVVLGLSLLLLTLSALLSSLNWKNSPSLFHLGPLVLKKRGKYRVKKRLILGSGLLVALILSQLNYDNTISATGNIVQNDAWQQIIFDRQHPAPLPEVKVEVNRQWFMKSTPRGMAPTSLTLTAKPEPPLPKHTTLHYKLDGTEIGGEMSWIDDAYFVEVPLSANPAGEYRLTVELRRLEEVKVVLEKTLYLSEPVLVAWTLDWEGYDVPDTLLSSIAAQKARHHDIPITHFFNPRIYLESALPSARANALTDWVKNAAGSGDEIQMHLHMHYDVVEAAGLVPKTEPTWGFQGEGYDVHSTSYTQAEFEQILRWAEGVFTTNGLPPPTGFRAGGWFADEENLAALEAMGYLYDSSGREKRMWNGSTQSPWDLTAQTAPYFPNRLDQNQPASGEAALRLLEIPNNGGDAYAFSGEQMISRLKQNRPNTTAFTPISMVYLSHPQWQADDERTIETLLDYTDSQLYAEDSGPIVYVRLGDIYEMWAP